MLEFLEGEWRDMSTPVEWNVYKNFPSQMDVKQPTIKNHLRCHNLSLGLAIKVRACEGAGQEWNLGVTFHAPKSVGECEGMSIHIPKWVPTLGVGVLIYF